MLCDKSLVVLSNFGQNIIYFFLIKGDDFDWGRVFVEETFQTSSISESESSRTISESVSIDKDLELGFSRVTFMKSFLATTSISSSES